MQAPPSAAASAQADQARPNSHAIDVTADSATTKVNPAQQFSVSIVLICHDRCATVSLVST